MVPIEIKNLKILETKLEDGMLMDVTVKSAKCVKFRLRKFCLISSARNYLLCRYLPAPSQHGETTARCEIGSRLTMMATEQCQ